MLPRVISRNLPELYVGIITDQNGLSGESLKELISGIPAYFKV